MFLDVSLPRKLTPLEVSISYALNVTLNRFEPRQPEVCEDVLSTTSDAYETFLLSGTHMVFFVVFLFVTLNIRTKFRFLSFKDGGHYCVTTATRSNLPGKWRENVVITSLYQPFRNCTGNRG